CVDELPYFAIASSNFSLGVRDHDLRERVETRGRRVAGDEARAHRRGGPHSELRFVDEAKRGTGAWTLGLPGTNRIDVPRLDVVPRWLTSRISLDSLACLRGDAIVFDRDAQELEPGLSTQFILVGDEQIRGGQQIRVGQRREALDRRVSQVARLAAQEI